MLCACFLGVVPWHAWNALSLANVERTLSRRNGMWLKGEPSLVSFCQCPFWNRLD